MSSTQPIMILAIIFIVFVVGLTYYLSYRKRKFFQAYAARRGLTYQASDDSWTEVDLGWPYDQGRRHRAKHVLTGVYHGRQLVVFDHQWVTGSGKNQQSHAAWVVVLRLKRSFPKLVVGHEGVFGTMARAVGISDIELESDAFNRQYKVESEDRKFAYDVLHPRFMEWMMRTGADTFTISGAYIARASKGQLVETEFDRVTAYLAAIADQIPTTAGTT